MAVVIKAVQKSPCKHAVLSNTGSMLVHRLQRWTNIESALTKHHVVLGPMLVQCWSAVYDGGPTSNQHWLKEPP